MKKILIICVNYNSYEALKNFLESVDYAAQQAEKICQVQVWVADNSSAKQIVETGIYKHITCSYFACENDGYIGTIEKLLKKNNWTDISETDYLIISNVDICFSDNTLAKISTITDSTVGWIAPRIYSKCRNTEENPQAIHRYSKTKLCLLRWIYMRPTLYKLYKQSVHQLLQHHRNQQTAQHQQQEIYAGNGSIFIFTKAFLTHNAPFHYPCFLYGEELFFAELIRKSQLKTVFYPDIYIENSTHNVSTKSLGFEKRCLYSGKAIDYILKTFY